MSMKKRAEKFSVDKHVYILFQNVSRYTFTGLGPGSYEVAVSTAL